MSGTRFIHLRNHSDFSLLRGAMNIDKLISLAETENMPALALTDNNNLFGAYEFSVKAAKQGVQPLIGMQLTMQDVKYLQNGSADKSAGDNDNGIQQVLSKLVLIVQNSQGYDNLRNLVSDVYLQNDGHSEIAFRWRDIAKYNDGLICLSGGVEGAIGQAILHGQKDSGRDLCRHLQEIFKDRFYLEIARHGLNEEKLSEAAFLQFADDLGIPIVASNDCHFASADMHEAQDILACIGEGRAITDNERQSLSPEHYFKSQESMVALFQDLPDAVENTVAIAKRCGFALQKTEPALPNYKKLQGRDELTALTELAENGLADRLRAMPKGDKPADEQTYQDRLRYELGIINEMGFCGYFLIVADFTQWAKQQKIPVGPGRGSGAGSLVSWALKITDLDPLQYGLLFERFLNPERVSMPDFDIDFCQDLRERVIQYVQDEYGAEHVAQIATFGKLQARAVLRDVGRVLGMRYGHVDRICKMVPYNPADPKNLPQVMQDEPLLRQEYRADPQVRRLVDIAQKLEGLYRHVGTHAAGIVIGNRPLSEIIPLYRDPRSDMMVTQFSMKNVESVGLVKFDFLGLKTLTVIDKCLALIAEGEAGKTIDINHISLHDKAVFESLCGGSAIGVFQLESSGMQDVIRQVQPDRLEDLIAIVALYRPGPMENIPTYIRRKHGQEKTTYPHPLLEEVLAETFGIPVYQEQVMQMAQKLADYSLGGADVLRRAMGKKDQTEMAKERETFLAGAKAKNNIEAKQADKIFNLMEAFADYGFNKTHAAAYALLAYQTAYLKTRYPVEFMTALLCLDSGNTERLEVLMDECQKMKITLQPVDINRSQANFSIDEQDGEKVIRYGLAALKGVGQAVVEKISETRAETGDFTNIYDFFERCDNKMLNKKLLESLVHAGAFDSLNPNRRQMFMALDMLRDYGYSYQDRQNSDQSFLFGAQVETQNRPILPQVEDWSTLQKAKGELESVGFYLSAHPLAAYQERLQKLGVKYGGDIASPDFKEPRAHIAAVITDIRTIRTKQNKKIAFIRAGDERGYFELTAYEEILERHHDLLQEHRLIFAEVAIKPDQGKDNRLQILSMSDLDQKFHNVAESLTLLVNEAEALQRLQQVFNEHSQKGKGRVYVVMKGRDISGTLTDITMNLGVDLNLTEDLRRAVKSLAGVEEIAS